jgi:hypothetical protein
MLASNDRLRSALIFARREMGKRKILGERQRKLLELMRQAAREGMAAGARSSEGKARWRRFQRAIACNGLWY